MNFVLLRTEYDRAKERAYVEFRGPDDDGGDAIATALFSYKTVERLSKKQLHEEIVRKARYLLKMVGSSYVGARTDARPIGQSGPPRHHRLKTQFSLLGELSQRGAYIGGRRCHAQNRSQRRETDLPRSSVEGCLCQGAVTRLALLTFGPWGGSGSGGGS